jgi:hypothetical protein
MPKTIEEIERIPVHFILCTERTGSSLLSLMLNLHPKIICTSEELFALYFYKKYKDKSRWSEKDLQQYVDEFWLMSEQSLGLYFTTKEKFYNALLPYKEQLPYSVLIKLTYLNFIEPKAKDEIEIIIDKQIKYFFHLPVICELFPQAKFIILTRDVRDNVTAKEKRGLNVRSDPFFLASVWNYSYSNIDYLTANHKQIHSIRYEDLVKDPKKTLSDLFAYIGVTFEEGILKTDGVFSTFLEQRKDHISDKEYERVKKFNSELALEINTEKIGVYKNGLTPRQLSKIEKLNYNLMKRFGYDVSQPGVNLSPADKWNRFLAWLYRPALLGFYYALPFSLKIFIKRLRK